MVSEDIVELSNADITNAAPTETEKKEKRPKRRTALLLGYCGTGYHGMQFNQQVPTIEAELHRALCEVDAIDASNRDSFKKISFQRCARTDKGVHALGQLVSANLILPEEDEGVEGENILAQRLNRCLPDQIRVWGHVRTGGSFNAKNRCNGRLYEYLLPTFCLRPFSDAVKAEVAKDPSEHTVERWLNRADEEGIPRKEDIPKTVREDGEDGEDEADGEDEKDEPKTLTQHVTPEQMKEMRGYRISEDQLQRFREVLSGFEGTHNYHNFTIARPFWNSSAKRIMKSVTASDPFVRGSTEWVSVSIKGQSFMLHQIRKMIGFACLATRASAPKSLFRKLTGEVRVNVPKAPSLGLFLRQPIFDAYNEQCDSVKALNSDFKGSKIDFSKYSEEMDEFREKWIYDQIVRVEEAESSFGNWMEFITLHSYEFAYLRPDGEIPEVFYKLAHLGIYDQNRKSKSVMKNFRPKNLKRKKMRDA